MNNLELVHLISSIEEELSNLTQLDNNISTLKRAYKLSKDLEYYSNLLKEREAK